MGSDPPPRAASVLVPILVACVLLVSATGIPGTAGSAQTQARAPEDVKIVTVHPESQDRLWPFTSSQRRFETLTLPINVIVRGNDTRIRWFLRTGHNVNWNESEGEWQGIGEEAAVDPSDDSTWYPAHGATRYTYIQSSRDPYRGWRVESYQLHDGDYFGTRYHIRAYTAGRGNGSWTAIQAHHEYWDWFRLRHTVGSTATARGYVERSFYGSPAIERVSRERYANGGILDADGWVTIAVMRKPTPPDPEGEGTDTGTGSGIGSMTVPSDGIRDTTGPAPPYARGLSLSVLLLAGAVLSVGVADVRERLLGLFEVRRPESLAVLTAVSLLMMPSLRWASITAERSLSGLSPKVIAGLGYLLVAVGLPLTVAFLAHETRAGRAAPLAAVGLGTGILFDYALVGLTAVPVSIMLHRLAVVLGLGLVAAAGARLGADRPGRVRFAVAAGLVWVGVLAWPLLDAL